MNQPSFSISIPKPCHEDWNKMTPDEKGAFCGSCQKSVHDFTSKSDEEIMLILAENQGKKICGRFNPEQLDRPINFFVSAHDLPRNISPFRAFALALFLVFGTVLFNCHTASGQVKGKIRIKEAGLQNNDKTDKPQNNNTVIKEPLHVMGGPKITPTNSVQDSSKTPKQIPVKKVRPQLMGDVVCEMPLKGEMVVKQVPADTSKPKTPKNIPVKTDSNNVKEYLVGKIAVSMPPKTDAVKTDSLNKQPQLKSIKKDINIKPENAGTLSIKQNNTVLKTINPEKKTISIEVLSNPSDGKIMLRYLIKENNTSSVELYNLDGIKVKTLVASQRLYEGIYATAFDISDLPDGIYICLLQSGMQSASNKIILTK